MESAFFLRLFCALCLNETLRQPSQTGHNVKMYFLLCAFVPRAPVPAVRVWVNLDRDMVNVECKLVM